jgi:uncharacterized SAM-binding protein YcdF (DUF218 family)
MLLKLKKHRILLALAAVLILACVYTFRHLGTWIVKKDELQKSTYAVIMMGSLSDRVLEAYDVYRKGHADTLLIVESHQTPIKGPQNQTIHLPGGEEQAKQVLIKLGVPEENVKILPGSAESTLDEAQKIKAFLEQRKEKDRLIMVTSMHHSYRAHRILENTLNSGNLNVEVLSSPSKYTELDPENWWKDKNQAEKVLIEWGKLVFGLFE